MGRLAERLREVGIGVRLRVIDYLYRWIERLAPHGCDGAMALAGCREYQQFRLQLGRIVPADIGPERWARLGMVWEYEDVER